MIPWLAISQFILKPRNLLIIAASVAVLVVAAKLYHAGQSSGYHDGQQQGLDVDKQQASQEHSSLQAQLNEANARAAKAEAGKKDAEQRIAAADRRSAAIQAQRDADREAIAKLSDSEVFHDVRGKLGILAPYDPAPTFSPRELREIDASVSAVVQLQQQVAAINDKVDGMRDKYERQLELTGIANEKLAGFDEKYNALWGHYVRAYNGSQKKPSRFLRVITFGRYKGKHLDLPDPVTLQQAK